MKLIARGNSIRVKQGNKISPAYNYATGKEKFEVMGISKTYAPDLFELLYRNKKWKKKTTTLKFIVTGDTITFID